MRMLTRVGLLVIAGLFALSVVPGFAFDCPNTHKTLMNYYEKTTKVQGVDHAKLAQAKTLLDDGMKAHEAGQHKKSMEDMADAMKLINASRP